MKKAKPKNLPGSDLRAIEYIRACATNDYYIPEIAENYINLNPKILNSLNTQAELELYIKCIQNVKFKTKAEVKLFKLMFKM